MKKIILCFLFLSCLFRAFPAYGVDPTADEGIEKKKKTAFFPKRDLFYPLIADYKEPRFSAHFVFYHAPNDNFSAGLVSFGERFHIFRYSPFAENEGLQLSIDAGILSIFNFASSSINLINADYFAGLPISWRQGPWSFRLRPYHQSSHLGDEFLLTNSVHRVNLSYEALDLLASYEWKKWRLYGGGEFIMRREPSTFDRWVLHAGTEWTNDVPLFWKAFPIAALDVKSYQENDFFPNMSARVGLNFRKTGERPRDERNLTVHLDLYYGHSPHGQFYEERILESGIGLSLDF